MSLNAIDITADEMETLRRLEGEGVVCGGSDGFPKAHMHKLFVSGLCKSLGNNEYLCNAKGRHLVEAYRANPDGFQLVAGDDGEQEAAPKKAPRRKRA